MNSWLVVIGLGEEERAEMLVKMDRVVKELKEQKWKLSETKRSVGELDLYLGSGRYADALAVLKRSERPLVIEVLGSLLQVIVELEEQKAGLEKSLGLKFAELNSQ